MFYGIQLDMAEDTDALTWAMALEPIAHYVMTLYGRRFRIDNLYTLYGLLL